MQHARSAGEEHEVKSPQQKENINIEDTIYF
jgi:hypothetical protein